MNQGKGRPMGAIFDLDGTVLDTLGDLTDAVNATLLSLSLPPRRPEEVRGFVGNGIGMLLRRALGEENGTLFEQAEQRFYPYYREHCCDTTKPYEGIEPLLRSLREEGIRCALVSNKADSAVSALVARFFPGLFDFVTGERDGIPRKPAPDGIFAAADAMGVSVRDCIYIGDSEVDIQTAENAGVSCLSVTWGFRTADELVRSGAGTLITKPRELGEFLISLYRAGL